MQCGLGRSVFTCAVALVTDVVDVDDVLVCVVDVGF